MQAHYEVFQGKRNIFTRKWRWYFQLIASNGEPQDLSEPYTTKQHAQDGVVAHANSVLIATNVDLAVSLEAITVVYPDEA